jgi:TIR domain
MKAFFISYTQADEPWAKWIAWTLEQAGFSVAVLQLYRSLVIGWPDAPSGLFGLRSVQVAPV